MTSFILFLVLSSFFHNVFSSHGISSASSASEKLEKRKLYEFSDEVKWDCFYLTTYPVHSSVLDPAIWRQDEYGNLLMAGLNYCKGALCYNFDHRYAISNIPNDKATIKAVVDNMKSINNCQAMSLRVNSLKGSAPDEDIRNVVAKFGYDHQTMSLFTANNFKYALEIQAKLIDEDRAKYIKEKYGKYNTKYHNLRIGEREEYLNFINSRAAQVVTNIQAALASS